MTDRPPAPPLADGEHPARDLLNLLGRTHALAILYYLIRVEPRSWRFNELESELDVSPSTLSTRLEELADAGLIQRTTYDEVPPRVEYEATEKARELNAVFERLHDWAEDHWPDAEDAFDAPESDEEA